MAHCKICGDWNCKKHTVLLGKAVEIKEFSGSSPPEIFVGRWNYPNVYTGILSPQEHGDTGFMSNPEEWHKRKMQIPEILELRNKLIYGRKQGNIKRLNDKFSNVMKEVAMTHKSVATEFKLKKPIKQHEEHDAKTPLIAHTGEVEKVRLQENPSIKPRVDYLVNDVDMKSVNAMIELNKSGIETSNIIKLLSAGLLGLRKNRKLVPTKWAITATDDALSKEKLERIRYYSEIKEISVFSAEYLGNHYEFLLLPEKWSFEVIEISLKNIGVWKDYETFFPRKKYADSVTGAYYVNRLALCEYFDKIKRQGQCVVFRQVGEEYTAPLGVGILRQVSREAFSRQGRTFGTIKEALDDIQTRLKIPISNWTDKSFVLKNYGKQRKLTSFFSQYLN
ncbi:hypothetical protein J4217_00740 [Candidatus Pacearchaeota archaeon]|nr:hypothetical protein [Candidatus Pacearchaeota archaeon]